MGLYKRVLIAVIVILAAAPVFAAGSPHTVYGIVEGSEASTSCAWKYYIVTRPSETIEGNLSEKDGNYFWQANAGNLYTAWNVGNDSIAIVKKENNSGTASHTGYYAVMNEDLIINMPQDYNRCTVREIPIPTASAGSSSVNLSWSAAATDPAKDDHGNNITGYNVYRSTDPASGFTKINSSLVTGTVYIDSTGTPGLTYYYTIELVFRGGVALGVYSANSNAVEFPTPTPNVTGITPNSGRQGDTMAVTISGTDASWSGDMASDVHFSGTGITVNSATGAGLNINANITIASDAATTARSVTVDGATGAATFTVNPAVVPNVTGITPNSGRQGKTIDVTISGADASWSGNMISDVHFSGTGITVNTASGGGLTIAANITIASGAATTARTVIVDGATGSTTFTVNGAISDDVELNLIYSSTTGNIHWTSLPYINTFDNASDVIAKINADHGLPADSGDKVTQIGRWDSATQTYVTYDYLGFLGWSGTDFTVVTREAIFLNIASDVNATLPGTHDPAFGIDLAHNTTIGNIFWISLPNSGDFANAASIIDDINANEGEASDSGNIVTQIGRWNGSTQSYETWDYLGFLGWSGDNFSFVPGEGYFANIASDVTDWRPSTN